VITKIEKYTNINQTIKLNNKLKEFSLSQERYSQNIQRMLEDPSPVELSVIQESLEKCSQESSEDQGQDQPKPRYYLCKYPEIGKRLLREYIQERPEDIPRILDQHDQLLKTSSILSEEKKLIHHSIHGRNIIVKQEDDIPVITNFKQSAFLFYEEEMNMENFETILKEATEAHCIEAHILLYLGKKKQGITIEEWKQKIYDDNQHTEATSTQQSNPQSTKSYPEYMNRPYEEVYREIQKTFSKWDIYSINHMMLLIVQEIQEPSLEIYKSKLTELLSTKTIELTNDIPK